jgi:hypothetical protein
MDAWFVRAKNRHGFYVTIRHYTLYSAERDWQERGGQLCWSPVASAMVAHTKPPPPRPIKASAKRYYEGILWL